MTKRSSADWHGCPIRYSASIFGDRWCLLILRDLIFLQARHYADFLNAGEGISTNILAARLATLESEGLVEKQPDPEHGKRFIYQLTNKGLDLVPAFLEIVRWANKWDKKTEVPVEFARELRKDSNTLAKRIIRELRQRRQ
ncbi:MAG: helix-turn-helix domain-containing protein [Planctomycetota bacterium]